MTSSALRATGLLLVMMLVFCVPAVSQNGQLPAPVTVVSGLGGSVTTGIYPTPTTTENVTGTHEILNQSEDEMLLRVGRAPAFADEGNADERHLGMGTSAEEMANLSKVSGTSPSSGLLVANKLPATTMDQPPYKGIWPAKKLPNPQDYRAPDKTVAFPAGFVGEAKVKCNETKCLIEEMNGTWNLGGIPGPGMG